MLNELSRLDDTGPVALAVDALIRTIRNSKVEQKDPALMMHATRYIINFVHHSNPQFSPLVAERLRTSGDAVLVAYANADRLFGPKRAYSSADLASPKDWSPDF